MKSRISTFKYLIFSVSAVWFLIFVHGCVEPFEAEFEDFESALVIEATITNELKQQKIYITRTFKFLDDGPTPESNASVRIVGDEGTIYEFTETEPGLYTSEIAFLAQSGVKYQLKVDADDGRSYSSNEVAISSISTIDAIRAERIVNDSDEDGIAIFVDSFDPTGRSSNYRYTYEETYRIIPPNWEFNRLITDPEVECGVEVVLKEREDRVCYTTDFSNDIILTSTRDLEEDRVGNFMVRFLNRDNYIISHRYSILVKQHVQSNMAYSFYKTLNDFSGEESLFSETQPGFLEGNLFSIQNENEKVLGFFEVTSVSEKRLFFNYSDFYPDEPLPPFPNPCNISAPPLFNMGGGCVLSVFVEKGSITYFGDNAEPINGQGPYFTVDRICGDCTVLGETSVPDFWIE